MLKADLQQRARMEQLDSVIFLDPVDKDRLAALMRRADLGMQILANVPAFYYGTSPNKFFDYIGAGLPVLINYPGWLAEVVSEHACGFAVPPDDPNAFADALQEAAKDRERLRDMGRRARDLAVTQFDWDVLASRLVDWLESEFRAL
jgi:glycosyltransferase involved in cell wall biosynthesis